MHTDDDVTNTLDSGLVEPPTDETADETAAGLAAHEAAAEGDVTLPLAAERLNANVRQGERGQVHIRKRVIHERQRAVVPLTIEAAIIEHIPADRFDPDAPRAADELIIPLVEERLVVRKETVVREYLRVRKQSRVERREVSGEVRREVAEVEETPNPAFGEQTAPLIRELRADESTESDAAT
jgi:uncharacterized protein (TIGR02271 family)